MVKTTKTTSGNESSKGYRTPNRQGEYAKIAVLVPKAIAELEKLLTHPNCNVRLGAINKILDKCLPDLKAIEGNQQINNPIQVRIVTESGFHP